MEIAYNNGTAFREIPMKEAYGFVHHTDFLVCQSACIAIDDVAE